jgi:hypothetical protein
MSTVSQDKYLLFDNLKNDPKVPKEKPAHLAQSIYGMKIRVSLMAF